MLFRSGKVLDASLPYESRPNAERKVKFDEAEQNVVMVAHAIRAGDRHKVSVSSGFALNVPSKAADGETQSVVLTCAHTFQEVFTPQYLLPDTEYSFPFVGTTRIRGFLHDV